VKLIRSCLLLFALTATAGCRNPFAAPPASTPIPTPVAGPGAADEDAELPTAVDTITASGRVVASVEVRPGFARVGRVAEVLVAHGDLVRPGDVLVTLEDDQLRAAATRAEEALAAARSQLALLQAGPRTGELEGAQAAVEAAEAALTEAVANRDQTAAGAETARAKAEARLAAAEETWMTTRIDRDWIQDRDEAEDWEKEEAAIKLRAAELDRAAAEAALGQAAESSAVEIRVAQGAVSEATAGREAAEAELALLQAGPRAEEIAVAQAEVEQAKRELDVARIALEQATLRAPRGGTVTAVAVNPGETVTVGQPVLTLADLTDLRVETTDLSETDVDQVARGQLAAVYVEALDMEVPGTVLDIAPRADVLGGDVVYAVTIKLDEQPEGLRWGMSVEVEIH